jgi:hypothetical protein
MVSPGEYDTPRKTELPEYDWATFIAAYAFGSWDPREAPRPPRSSFERHQSPSLDSSPADILSDCRLFSISPSGGTYPSQRALPSSIPQGATSPRALSDVSTSSSRIVDTPQTTNTTPTGSSTPFVPGSSSLVRGQSSSRRSSTSSITPSIPHRLRNSFADIRSSSGSRPTLDPPPAPTIQPTVPHSEATTTAAAMRWAAAGVSIAPLALPSPEHELTDPFRNARAAIPGSYPPEVPLGPQYPRQRRRLGSFWEGTIDVDRTTQAQSILSSIQGSPPSTPPTESSESEPEPSSATTATVSPPYITPASGPMMPGTGYRDDYFGFAGLSTSPEGLATVPLPQQHTSSDSEAAQMASVAPRRVNITRQSSSPLPNNFSGSTEASPVYSTDAGAGRALSEEAMFLQLGYLVPPCPPDEFQRRRALYQFNIWNTGPDTNFDRIEHLTRLVFSTKTAIICLLDENEQYVCHLPCGNQRNHHFLFVGG